MSFTRPFLAAWALSTGLLVAAPLVAQTVAADAPADTLPSVPLTGAAVTGAEPEPNKPVAPEPPPAPLTCRQITDRANAADLKAASAQASKAPPDQVAARLDESIQWWTQAVATCDGRARDRAERNLADSQRGRESLQGQLGANPECLANQKDATQLQELAQQAVRERRWLDASVMFRKAENMWDEASEVCTGELQATVLQRREQAAQDGHNAEFCAPLFDRAREYAQLIRRQPGAQALEKQTQSLALETLWREADKQCQGAAQGIARTNAQNAAKDRGTPWVATPLPAGVELAAAKPQPRNAAPASVAVTKAPPPATKVATPIAPKADASSSAKTVVTAAVAATPPAVASPATALAASAVDSASSTAATAAAGTTAVGSALKFLSGLLPSAAPAPAAAPAAAAPANVPAPEPAPAVPQVIDEVMAGVRFQGTFVNQQGLFSGKGKVQWPSGDTYQGEVLNHQPHGQGNYQWANGQTYQGDWVQGQPSGTGAMKFANGNQYEGGFVQGVPQGRGKLTYAWGDFYEGDFAGGVPDGSGSYRWKNGDQYTGDWKAGQKHGTGTQEWATGDKWTGRYENDQQTTGTLTRKAP